MAEDVVVEYALSEDILFEGTLFGSIFSGDVLLWGNFPEGILHSFHNPLNDLYAACLTPPEENVHVDPWTCTNANECDKEPERDTDKITGIKCRTKNIMPAKVECHVKWREMQDGISNANGGILAHKSVIRVAKPEYHCEYHPHWPVGGKKCNAECQESIGWDLLSPAG